MARFRVQRIYTIYVVAKDETEAEEKASEIPESDWNQEEEVDEE